jgi:hypothetical protein
LGLSILLGAVKGAKVRRGTVQTVIAQRQPLRGPAAVLAAVAVGQAFEPVLPDVAGRGQVEEVGVMGAVHRW